ncbi:MAG: fibronectin type III domain-containing protein [Nibricoccus sp.]
MITPRLLPRSVAAAFARACSLLAFGSAVAIAAPLKIDINNTGRPLTEGLDPAFTPWTSDTSVFPTSATFSGVTIAFARAGSVGTGLQTGYWKEGVQSTAYNVKLTGDGLKVADGETGAQIEMRISGLSTGAHSLLLYLNSWDGPTSIAPLDISVNGTEVVSNLPVSVRVTDNNNATTSYLTFNATSGQDVVILVKADTGGSQTSKNVHINGFEIDTPNAKAQANNPLPANADEHVNADSASVTLQWGTAVNGAASHNVYFGTSESSVTSATTSSSEYKGNRTTNTYAVSGINTHLTYYWRIDEVASGGTVTKGNTWMFRPRRLAFPGAEGYGRFARGGRGGVVVKVTNLNDTGAGSLRDAIEGNYGPRTVVFDVAGLITLQSDIVIDGTMPYITVAGQTAPGKGITIKRQQFTLSGSRDVTVRYLRLLVGKESGETQNATGMAGVDHCIMDHVSAGWGIDEGLSTRGGKNLTFQRNSLSEALNVAGHQNYPAGTAHGYAASIGGDTGSFHHNLLAHNEGRNWSMAGGLDGAGYYAGKLDIFNNVVYNYGGRTTDGGAHQVNFVNNYYKRGPANGITTLLNPQYGGFPGTQQYYMVGNVLLNGSTTVTNQTSLLSIGTESGGVLPQNSTPPYSATVSSAFFSSYATIHTATNAYKQVLSDVGCNLPQIDNRDTRIVGETIAGTATYTGSVSGKKGLPDTTNDVGGWESYPTTSRASGFDSDNDGMPNWWETIKGLSTSSPSGNFTEANADTDGNGYTNLEEYLNWMAAPNFEVTSGTSIDIDLHALARGYLATSPTFTFSNVTNGTVTLISSRYARFTPNTTANALGGFTFTVTDNQSDSMSRSVGLRIIGSGTQTLPSAPQDLVAQVYSQQVVLGWSPVSGATSYKVKRATTSGGAYTVVTTVTGTTYSNTGLTNGTTYYYVVSAANAIGDGPDSAQVAATPSAGSSTIPAVTIQAESGTISGGTFDSNNAGFNGTGFANLGVSSSSLQLGGISGGSAGGTATLTVRFALGATSTRTGNLVINGSSQSITFPVTGAWTTWTTLTRTITLAAGSSNTIRFETTGQDLANIDQISIAP